MVNGNFLSPAPQPASWNYGYDPATGVALASYPGEVIGAAMVGPSFGYPSIAAFAAAQISTDVQSALVQGYYTPGDGGGAVYIRSTGPAGPGKVQSADGSWWIISGTTFNPLQFGAKGDLSFDDTQAVKDCFNICVSNSAPAFLSKLFKITSNLSISGSLYISGWGVATSGLVKYFNGDLISIQTGAICAFENLWLKGQGATYTGRGITYDAITPLNRIEDCRITDFAGYCVEFIAPQAGSQFTMRDSEVWSTTLANPAIRLPNDGGTAAPRHFINIFTSGGNLIDTNGGNNVEIIGGNINNLTMGAAASKVLLTGVRIASVGADITVNGTDCVMTGCACAGNIKVAAGATNCTVASNSLASGYAVSDNSGNNSNFVEIAPVAYTPVWSTSGAQPALGNGTLVGQYERKGKQVRVHVEFVAGSTTTFGSSTFQFSLPFTNNATYSARGVGDINIGGTLFDCVAVVAANSNQATLHVNNTSNYVNSGNPTTFVAGSTIVFDVVFDM